MSSLDDVERCYWSREAFLRCLRACKWNYDAALRRAEETCVWRREYGVETLSADDVAKEGETGKEVVYGFDRQCRPVLYMASRSAPEWPRSLTRSMSSIPIARTRRPVQSRLTLLCGVWRSLSSLSYGACRGQADNGQQRTIDLCPPTLPATEMLCLCIDFGANRNDAKSQPTSLGQARKV